MIGLRRVLVASGGLGAMLAGAGAGNGAVLIGSTLSADATSNICSSGVACTYLQTLGGVPSTTAPISGVVTSWRVKSGSGGATVALRVIHSFGGGKYMERQSVAATQTLGVGVNTFPARIPIRGGDAIGLDNASSAPLFGVAGEAVYVFNPALVPFTTATPAVTVGSVGRELLLNATLEADGDGDGYGDETQDGCLADRLRQAPPCAPAFAVTGVRLATSPAVLRLSRKPSRGFFGLRAAFRTNRPAAARLTLTFVQSGRRFAGTCVPATVLASGPACALNHVVRDVRATVPPSGPSAGSRISIDARRLRAGTYRAALTVSDRIGPGAVTRTFVVRIRA